MNVIFEQLAATSSRLEKEAILKAHTDDELLKKVLKLALDPYIQFYIRRIPVYTRGAINSTLTMEHALQELEKLFSRQLTGNAAFQHLQKLKVGNSVRARHSPEGSSSGGRSIAQ
jgi:hypothetical protein